MEVIKGIQYPTEPNEKVCPICSEVHTEDGEFCRTCKDIVKADYIEDICYNLRGDYRAFKGESLKLIKEAVCEMVDSCESDCSVC